MPIYTFENWSLNLFLKDNTHSVTKWISNSWLSWFWIFQVHLFKCSGVLSVESSWGLRLSYAGWGALNIFNPAKKSAKIVQFWEIILYFLLKEKITILKFFPNWGIFALEAPISHFVYCTFFHFWNTLLHQEALFWK